MSWKRGDEPVSLGQAHRLRVGLKAVEFHTKELGSFWIPRDYIHDDSEVWEVGGAEGELVIKRWLAEARGYI